MNRYEYLKNNESIVFEFIKNGIISYQLIRDMEIYQAYENINDSLTNELKYILLAEEYELSNQRIKQIIISMKNEIK